jgi:hypothetical protein
MERFSYTAHFSMQFSDMSLWPAMCSSTRVNAEVIDIPRIRTEFLRQAVLWVSELAAQDRLEARDPAGELRRYFESVVDSLPPDERRELSQQIDDICGRLGELQTAGLSARD